MRKTVIILILTLITVLGHTQNKVNKNTVRGQVVKLNTQTPVPFISVIITDVDKGAITDENGYFEIEGVPGGYHSAYIFGYGFSPLM